MRSVISKREMLTLLADSVLENGGMNYLVAVKWCLENIHSAANMQMTASVRISSSLLFFGYTRTSICSTASSYRSGHM
ncbi:hypothetical protein F4811DRAFT_499795, partial [Daldinia bambusicola]